MYIYIYICMYVYVYIHLTYRCTHVRIQICGTGSADMHSLVHAHTCVYKYVWQTVPTLIYACIYIHAYTVMWNRQRRHGLIHMCVCTWLIYICVHARTCVYTYVEQDSADIDSFVSGMPVNVGVRGICMSGMCTNESMLEWVVCAHMGQCRGEYHSNIHSFVHISLMHIPLTEEITLNIFESPDMPVFPAALLSDGDSVYSRKPLFEILETPEKTCLICTGTPVKTCWNFWQS